MSETISARIQLRRGTLAQWTAANPVLLAGEAGFETDTQVLRMGDGTTPFLSLTGINLSAEAVNTLLAGRIASQAQAEAGSNNTNFMTPLRVKQALAIAGVGDQIQGFPGGNISIETGAIGTGTYRYSVPAGDTGGPPGVVRGALYHSRRGPGGGETQLLVVETVEAPLVGQEGSVFTRARGVGSWNAWRRLAWHMAPLTTEQVTDPDDETFGPVSGQRLAQQTKASFSATGDAPMFACRAWVNFDGTTLVIRGKGNVSSITRLGVGQYRINFTEPMLDANYAFNIAVSGIPSNQSVCVVQHPNYPPEASNICIRVGNSGSGAVLDVPYISVSIVR